MPFTIFTKLPEETCCPNSNEKKSFFSLSTWSEDSKNVELSSSPIWSHLAHSQPGITAHLNVACLTR